MGLENRGREAQVKECGQPVKLEKAKKHYSSEPPERGAALPTL